MRLWFGERPSASKLLVPALAQTENWCENIAMACNGSDCMAGWLWCDKSCVFLDCVSLFCQKDVFALYFTMWFWKLSAKDLNCCSACCHLCLLRHLINNARASRSTTSSLDITFEKNLRHEFLFHKHCKWKNEPQEEKTKVMQRMHLKLSVLHLACFLECANVSPLNITIGEWIFTVRTVDWRIHSQAFWRQSHEHSLKRSEQLVSCIQSTWTGGRFVQWGLHPQKPVRANVLAWARAKIYLPNKKQNVDGFQGSYLRDQRFCLVR